MQCSFLFLFSIDVAEIITLLIHAARHVVSSRSVIYVILYVFSRFDHFDSVSLFAVLYARISERFCEHLNANRSAISIIDFES